MASEAIDHLAPDVRLLTPGQVAEQWGIAEHTLARWRSQGTGPRFVRVGRSIRYRAHDLNAWLESNSHQETIK